MTKLLATAAFVIALVIGSAPLCFSAAAESQGTIVELETPLESAHPLQGYLRHPTGKGPSPAVVLLHSCNGNFRRLDERWGNRIASWGYVTLAQSERVAVLSLYWHFVDVVWMVVFLVVYVIGR